jgi:hypothetical protein
MAEIFYLNPNVVFHIDLLVGMLTPSWRSFAVEEEASSDATRTFACEHANSTV